MATSIAIDDRPELVFALVGAAGVRLDDLGAALKSAMGTFGYQTIDIRLSDLLESVSGAPKYTGMTEFDRIRHFQDLGNAFRGQLQKGDALARASIAKIREMRAEVTGSPDKPAPAYAYILHQLKHPDEVDLLRRVYGTSFLLIAGHSPRATRITDLARRMARKDLQPEKELHLQGKAADVIVADEKQEDDFGQNTRDTYPKADFFANLGVSGEEVAVRRFVDLVFGHPFHTPKPDEYAMYQASAVSLRSSDDNRQVGAVIVGLTRREHGQIKNADVIAVGMNEVPHGGGGFYWDQDSPDHRDQRLLQHGEDRAHEIKVSALTELIERMAKKNWFERTVATQRASDLARDLLPSLKRTQFMDIGEFSRPVHAEMASLIDAARRGVAVEKHSMYVTTFPCHNCAKHIIAAGIARVVYLEPYPKSRAVNLYGEEIISDSLSGTEEPDKTVFFAFTGIAPRQYRNLFSMAERGAKKGHSLREWYQQRLSLAPLHVQGNAALMYLAAECQALAELPLDVYVWDKEKVCSNYT